MDIPRYLHVCFLALGIPLTTHALAAGLPAASPTVDTSTLTGDAGLACAAILCLSGSNPPHECNPALSRFFSIKMRKLSDTLDARESFLNLCPAAGSTSQMSSLAKALARGAGRCDAASLNASLRYDLGPGGDYGTTGYAISDRLPSYCAAWIQHEYVRVSDELPRYVGTPAADGFWVEANRYAGALAKYEREQAAKKAARENYAGGGN